MRRETAPKSTCEICDRVAELRLRSQPIARVLGRRFVRSNEDERAPVDPTALAWNTEASASLTREMSTHARCARCSILMGPGHVESVGADVCRTCQVRHSSTAASDSGKATATTYGQRGWYHDGLSKR